MKFYHDADETGVTFDDRDRDIARAAAETADSLFDLADAAGVGSDGACDNCGTDARLRPVAAETEDGPGRVDVCAACQDALVAERLSVARNETAEIDTDAEPVPDHARGTDA